MPFTTPRILKLCLICVALCGLARAESPKSYEIPAEFTAPAPDAKPLPRLPDGPARNVIFMIGDGMGAAQAQLGRLAIGKGAAGRLNLDRMPVTGIQFTYPDAESGVVTDSAASATAMASGVKTLNHALGLLPDGKWCRSVAELAHANGRSAGLAVTVSLTHATPAGFYAHNMERGDESDIGVQMADSGFEVLLGAGMKFLAPRLEAMRAASYTVAVTRDEMNAAKGDKIIGVFAPELLDDRKTTEGARARQKEIEPTLAAMTDKAIEVLSKDPDGFFLMVEGSQIDKASHENDAPREAWHMLAFDAAVARALDFAAARKDTLVVVTADHETGGLALQEMPGDPKSPLPDVKWTGKKHTCTPVPVYAFGPGADAFTGSYDNTQTGAKLAAALSLKEFPKIEAAPN